jgi:hypothetical protein
MVFWFISPWEAARLSMETQRLIALRLFGLPFPKAQSKEQRQEERASGEETASVSRGASALADSEHISTPSVTIEPGQRRTVAARSTHKPKKANVIKRRSNRDKAKR